jgi:WD40 repeat protein
VLNPCAIKRHTDNVRRRVLMRTALHGAVSWQCAPVLSMLFGGTALCRLWDVHITKCRQVLRGHVDSVNDIQWQPYGAAIATGKWLGALWFCSRVNVSAHSSST